MKKVYSLTSIIVGAFVGGPLAVGYLLASNFRRFGKYNYAKNSLWISLIASLILIATLISLPSTASNAATHYFIPVLLVVLAKWISDKYQRADIEEHENGGGYFYSIWRAVGMALLFGVVTVLLAAITFLLLDLFTVK